MKPEDAIEWLNFKNIYCIEPEGYVFKAAIEALEKQIPKTPFSINDKSELLNMLECPTCNRTILEVATIYKYCPYCGQAIK